MIRVRNNNPDPPPTHTTCSLLVLPSLFYHFIPITFISLTPFFSIPFLPLPSFYLNVPSPFNFITSFPYLSSHTWLVQVYHPLRFYLFLTLPFMHHNVPSPSYFITSFPYLSSLTSGSSRSSRFSHRVAMMLSYLGFIDSRMRRHCRFMVYV